MQNLVLTSTRFCAIGQETNRKHKQVMKGELDQTRKKPKQSRDKTQTTTKTMQKYVRIILKYCINWTKNP